MLLFALIYFQLNIIQSVVESAIKPSIVACCQVHFIQSVLGGCDGRGNN